MKKFKLIAGKKFKEYQEPKISEGLDKSRDLYTRLARNVFDREKLSEVERQWFKNITFSYLYGKENEEIQINCG